ncbi:hypothetical protein N0Q91_08685 [Sinorhizobium sp. K101]|nr:MULTISPECIES: hypothetical protein [unclassified Sinorhizobium]WEJ08830.1 hypothetical protein N0Q90_11630 [Sinorhizobium sp. M103]WEJ16628.1 hypothetical protein N0Q91_08685 [Sinorhizobium sp. K101]
MSITRRTFGARMAGAAVGLALVLSGFAAPANSLAAEFPEKPVTLVVWAGAGERSTLTAASSPSSWKRRQGGR